MISVTGRILAWISPAWQGACVVNRPTQLLAGTAIVKGEVRRVCVPARSERATADEPAIAPQSRLCEKFHKVRNLWFIDGRRSAHFMNVQHRNLPRVIVIGGGFGGLAAARALAGMPVRVTLLD